MGTKVTPSLRTFYSTLGKTPLETTSAPCVRSFRTSLDRMCGTTLSPNILPTCLCTPVLIVAAPALLTRRCLSTSLCSIRHLRRQCCSFESKYTRFLTDSTLLGGALDPSTLLEFVVFDPESAKHVCLKCPNFSHKSRSNVRNHVEAVHYSGHFTYACQVCGQQAASRNALNIHMTRFHKKQ